MNSLKLTAVLMAASVAAIAGQQAPRSIPPPALEGTWALNRTLSQFPREVGFGMDVVPSSRSGAGEAGAAPGDLPSGNPRSLTAKPQTEEVARNTRQLTDEVKNPPVRLTIVQTAAAVTVTDERGRSRTFRPDGREASQALEAGPITTVSKWEGARLVVRYKVEEGREVRYTFSRKADPPQLVVQAEFLERGGHDTVVRIYEPAAAVDPQAAAEPASPPRAVAPLYPLLPSEQAAARRTPPPATDPAQALVPAAAGAAPPAELDQRPGADLKGLAVLGVVVEELGGQAASCGLRQDAIEDAVSKSLGDAGFKVVRNTDEDSYVYVNVMTTATSAGYCFSRYDVYVYTNTTATLSYGSRPVLVQVSLMHRGGISGSGAKTHGPSVVQAIAQYVDQFAARIREANQ